MKKALIQYIGRAVPRPDDVLHTDRVWHKVNDIVEVPAEQAAHYTQHDMEWREISPSEAEQRQQAKEQVARLVDRIKVEWEPMTVEDLQSLKATIDERIAEVKAGRTVTSVKSKPALEPIDAAKALESDDASTREIGLRRIESIARVLGEMDPKDKDQWSIRGPRVNAVSELFGEKVSAEEIAEAIKRTDIHRLAL